MNAPRILAATVILVLVGCSASTKFTAGAKPSHENEDVVRSRQAPDFSTTARATSGKETPTTAAAESRPVGLLGLYGELLTGMPDGAGGPYDGSSSLAQITFATEGACSDPDIESAGRWMIFASTQHRTTSDIYLKSIPGRTLTQLTTDPADDVMPAFHPSGTKIAFASNRGATGTST